ncbi:MAG TPA: glycosyltransferase [Pantanalinema sp.]
MRLLKLTTPYPAYLRRFYAARPELVGASYQAQKDALAHDAFGLTDFWPHGLGELGYDAVELQVNNVHLQAAWAAENGVAQGPDPLALAREQVRRFQPDVLVADDYVTFSYDWLTELKEAVPSIRLTLGWCGAPYPDAKVFNAYDIVLSCIPELVTHFRTLGHVSEHLNHAFDPRILARLGEPTQQDIAFSFIGSIVRANRFHQQREAILLGLKDAVPLQIFAPSAQSSWRDDLTTFAKRTLFRAMDAGKQLGIPAESLARLPKVGRAASWAQAPEYPVHRGLKPFMRPPVFGLEMYRTLLRSKATFNSHIDISSNSASNMRLFEATGIGACLVTDWKDNLHDLFEPDAEVVTYRSAEECIEKVKWLMDHPRERDEIARRGQVRTLQAHTVSHRMARLDEIIQGAVRH